MLFNNVPTELRHYRNWICWRYENQGRDKLTKIPYCPIDGRMASVQNPQHWTTFDNALSEVHKYSGLGFVLSDNDPFCFIDFDATSDSEELAKQIEYHSEFNSYSERSPSGEGLHIIVKGQVPSGRRHKSIEIYSTGRYMTMTGNVFNRAEVLYRQACIDKLYATLGAGNTIDADLALYHVESTRTDFEIYNAALSASNGQKFFALWNGDIFAYHHGDHSAADFAMIDILAFYTQDRIQIARMFRTCGLGQQDKAKREDYMQSMITRAFDRVTPQVDVSLFRNEVDAYIQQMRQPEQKIVLQPTPLSVNTRKPYTPHINKDEIPIPPGLMGQIAKFIFDQSYKPVQEISITGALGLMAGICGKAYNVSATGLNMYLLLLAGTGRGKEEIARGVGKLVKSVQHILPTINDFLGPSDLASGQGLLRYVSDHPTKSFVSIFGEFGIKLKTLSDAKATSAELMLQRVLLDFFSKSGAADMIAATAYSDAERNTQPIYSPAFSMIGESAPDWFYHNINEDMIRSGLLPRFTVVNFEGKRPPSNYGAESVIPSQSLIEGLVNLATASQKLIASSQAYPVQFSPEAMAKSMELDELCDKRINEGSNAIVCELWNRAHLKALRIAALIAVGENPYAPVISLDAFLWAERFVMRSIDMLEAKFVQGETGNGGGELTQITLIRDACVSYLLLDYTEALKYGISSSMFNDKIIPYSYLNKQLASKRPFKLDRAGSAVALKRAVQCLIEDGEITEVPKLQAQKNYGFTGRCFVVRSTMMLDMVRDRFKNV